MVLKRNLKTVGIYRLTPKTESDNFRHAAVEDIMKRLKNNGVEIIIYEPIIKNNNFHGFKITNDLQEFKNLSDIILANRLTKEIEDV